MKLFVVNSEQATKCPPGGDRGTALNPVGRSPKTPAFEAAFARDIGGRKVESEATRASLFFWTFDT